MFICDSFVVSLLSLNFRRVLCLGVMDSSFIVFSYFLNILPSFFHLFSLRAPNQLIRQLPQDGKTRCTTGSVVSSLYHLKDTEHNNEDAGFFVFPDLSVRTEGSYRYVSFGLSPSSTSDLDHNVQKLMRFPCLL